MVITDSTARWVAPLSFAINFAAQQYGIFSSPNMKDVHDANLSFWSPQPEFIGAFFGLQQLFQLTWLYRLYKLDPKKDTKEKQELKTIVDYVPYYAVGNICIAVWMVFWNKSALKTANIFVLINSFTQLYYVFARLTPMETKSASSTLTHVVSKTFAGIGVLDLLHNGSVAYFDHQGPNMIVKILTGVGFGALATSSDWILGGCLVYDLAGLAFGQRHIGQTSWSNLLTIYAAGAAVIVAAKNWLRPPYLNGDQVEYETLTQEEGS